MNGKIKLSKKNKEFSNKKFIAVIAGFAILGYLIGSVL